MTDKKTLLLISQIHPYPHFDGGRMDVFYRIKSLYELGYDVVLISFYNEVLTIPDNSVLEKYCTRIFPIPYQRRSLSKFFSPKPYSIGTRERWNELNQIFETLETENVNIEAIIAESHHVMTVAERVKKQLNVPRIFLRSHNHEPTYMRSIARSSDVFSKERVFFTAEAIKYTWHLPKMMKSLDKSTSLWHISFDEYRKSKEKYPECDHHFLPAGIEINRIESREVNSSRKVLFAGALFSLNNLHGLNWYLKKVHPLMIAKDKDYKLLIAGNTAGARPEEIQQLIEYERVVFYDTPNNMDPIYSEAQVFINPMQFGAGVKLKTVDAAIRGIPVVTTTIGNEGTGLTHGKDLLVADSPEDFASCLSKLLVNQEKCNTLTRNAYQFLKENYNQKQSLAKLL